MRFVSIPLWAAFGTLVVLASAIGIVAFQNQQASAANGEINGTVTDDTTSALLPDICVTVYDGSFSPLGNTTTDSLGEYTVIGLPSGNVKVEFDDCGDNGYLTEWYDNKPDFDSAGTVAVNEEVATPGIDAALTLGGSINGTVTDRDGGASLQNICVDVFDSSSSPIGFDFTDSNGDYTVVGLPTGDYKVAFQDCNVPAAYLGEWYENMPDFASAHTVPVVEKIKNAGAVDAELTLGGSINGTVTDATDPFDPIRGIRVNVYDSSNSSSSVSSAVTASDGTYTVVGLPTGDYKVEFRDENSPATYLTEWYDDKPDFASATTVSVVQEIKNAAPVDAALTLASSIIICKETDPATDVLFDFDGNLGDIALLDGDCETVAPLAPGAYSVTETEATGWDLTAIDCTGTPAENIEVDLTTQTVTVTLKPDADVTCTFTNELASSIIICKETDPATDDVPFAFTGDLGTELLHGDCETFGQLEPGVYSVTEDEVTGWDLTAIGCTGTPAENIDVDLTTETVAVTLEVDTNVECTFTNERNSSITICKGTTPASSASFDFVGDLGIFALTDADCETFGQLEPGVYSVTEDGVTGWNLVDVTCIGTPAANTPVDLVAETVTIDLKSDEDVVCTFVNAKPSSITICKITNPATDDVSFNFDGAFGDIDLLHDGCETSGQLDPDEYSVTETEATGWNLTAIECRDTDADNIYANIGVDLAAETVTVTLEADTNVECTFTNEHASSIIICKETTPASGVSFDFDGALGDIDLRDGTCKTFHNLELRNYSVTENEPSGWNLTVIDCTGTPLGNINVDLADETVTVDLKAASTVICTFTNTSKTPVTPAGTSTPTATRTPTITATPTETNTATVTNTPTETNTPTNTATVTNTPTISSANTPTDTPTKTPTNPPSGGVLGDVGCEGWVNVIDASLLLQFIAGLLASLDCEQNADVNGDGTISPVDVTLILQWLARLIDSLGPTP